MPSSASRGRCCDKLVAAILAGTKTTTTAVAMEYEREGEPLPGPGRREAVADSAGNRVAVIETAAVRVVRLGDVDLAHALGEAKDTRRSANGGRPTSGPGIRRRCGEALGEAQVTVNDDTLVVAQTFRLLDRR